MRGVLLLYMGAPDSEEAIQPFLYNLFSDRDIIKLPFQRVLAFIISHIRARRVVKKYRAIGGSPLLEITQRQASALSRKLSMEVYIGMRYWKPFIGEAVEAILRAGIDKLVALPLYPQYSSATTGSVFRELKRQISLRGAEIDVTYIKSWHIHEGFIDALVESIESVYTGGEEIILTAHSMPLSLIKKGDPYKEQVEATAERVMSRLGIRAELAYQSGLGRGWLKPSPEEVLSRLKDSKSVVVCPISFVSDHLETLYDIDIKLKKYAEKLGLKLKRAPALNDSESFITALADIVKREV